MVAEFQHDRLDQMLYGFLQFPYQETHADHITKQTWCKLASGEGKPDYIVRAMASMAARFASWDACGSPLVTSAKGNSTNFLANYFCFNLKNI
jgi:hypothetical protein